MKVMFLLQNTVAAKLIALEGTMFTWMTDPRNASFVTKRKVDDFMDDINRLRVGKYSELRNASEIQDWEAHQADADLLREVFEAVDTDRNGVIDMHELGQLLKDVNMSTFQYSFSKYDADGNGMLDFDEFTVFYQDSLVTWLRGKDSKQIMRTHFEVRWP